MVLVISKCNGNITEHQVRLIYIEDIIASQLVFSQQIFLSSHLKVEYLIICIICDTDLVNKLILQVYTLHKYK